MSCFLLKSANPNVFRIAKVASQRSNSLVSVGGKIPFDPNIIIVDYRLASSLIQKRGINKDDYL